MVNRTRLQVPRWLFDVVAVAAIALGAYLALAPSGALPAWMLVL